MRILIDARPLVDSRSGGVSRVARALVDTYAMQYPNNELVFITTGLHPPLAHQLPSLPNCHRLHIRIPNKLWSLLCVLRLISLDRVAEWKSKPFDAVLLPNLGFVGTIKRPHILLLHDLSFLIEPCWFTHKTRWWHIAVQATSLIKNATHLLSVSERTKQDAVRLLGIQKINITVIPMGSPFKQDSRLRGNNNQNIADRRIILMLGQGDARKNSATAIKAVQLLQREQDFQDLEMTLVGKHFHPSDEELSKLYATASVFLYPSWYEGYGLPLHEAAAFGTPCIASTAGALPETAPTGTIFADPAKPHHWVEALRMVLREPERFRTKTETRSWNEAAQILNETLRNTK